LVTSNADARAVLVGLVVGHEPALLDWIVWHQQRGFDEIVLALDGTTIATAALAAALADAKMVTLVSLPPRPDGLSFIAHALRVADRSKSVLTANWLMAAETNDYLTFHQDITHLADLMAIIDQFGAQGMVLSTLIFGSDGQSCFVNRPLPARFSRCNAEAARPALRAFYRSTETLRLGLHRPYPRSGAAMPDPWLNGSATEISAQHLTWRHDVGTAGHALAQVNRYAARSAEEYLLRNDGEPEDKLREFPRLDQNQATAPVNSAALAQLADGVARACAVGPIGQAQAALQADTRCRLAHLRATAGFDTAFRALHSDSRAGPVDPIWVSKPAP
jgi:hypothetical protein